MDGKRTPIEASAQIGPMARAAWPLGPCVVAPRCPGDRRSVPVRFADSCRIGDPDFNGRDSSYPADWPHSHVDLSADWDSSHVTMDSAARAFGRAFCHSDLVAHSAARAFAWGRGDAERRIRAEVSSRAGQPQIPVACPDRFDRPRCLLSLARLWHRPVCPSRTGTCVGLAQGAAARRVARNWHLVFLRVGVAGLSLSESRRVWWLVL